jgi:hypothetical protein
MQWNPDDGLTALEQGLSEVESYVCSPVSYVCSPVYDLVVFLPLGHHHLGDALNTPKVDESSLKLVMCICA